tara:strand:- start:77 stop:1144 length:1068 start_codon:yes stop_codon:yes gene_type:complete
MANLISVSVLKYGNEEFGTTAADAKTMMLSSEHIIYGTNVETALGINATVATAATDALTITAHGLTSGEYIRVGDVGDSVGNFDIASSDYTPGKIFKQKITGADNVFLHGSEAHYDANTKQDITTGATGMTLPVYRVQGKLLYADTMGGGRPIEIRTVEPCVNMADGFGVSVKSNQLRVVEINKQNGVAYDADTISENNLMINLDRVIMTYEGNIDGGASADDWATWYDKSNNNCAGIDSAHVDMLQIETSLDSLKTSFLQHMGGLTVSDFATLTVNSRVVAFPDTSLSGLLRLKNIVVGRDSVAGELSADGTALGTAKAQIIMKGTGKHGYDTLALDENITTAVASTMEDHVIS